MSQTITFYPLGNAETCLLELTDGKKLLFDYAQMCSNATDDNRYDIQKALSDISEFEVVMFSHAHEDHVKGASDFFYLNHAKKYQADDRAKIKELRVSAAFLLDTDLENQSDAKIIRDEARFRLKEKNGIKIFSDPDTLTSWLETQNINYEDIEHLIIHAGETITLPDCNELQFFVHAPFSDDSDDVQDKNDPSIVLQLRLFNNERETNILITGDTKYSVLDKIVDISKANNNEDYLIWDIYDIPHHCSYTGLNEKHEKGDRIIEPTENVKWLLSQAQKRAVMIASCEKITESTSPPHIAAKRSYEKYTPNDVSFIATMEHISFKNNKPTPIVLKVDQFGITHKKEDFQSTYFKKTAPRAGM